MSMVFCRGCGKEIHESAQTCPRCGAQSAPTENSNAFFNSATNEIPDGIKGWSWGAFLLNWIWAIGNKTWIGLLALIPYVGIIMAIILGIKGREWAWKNRRWESIDHFNAVQRKWSIWAGIVIGILIVTGTLLAIAIPAYQDYKSRAEEVTTEKAVANPDTLPNSAQAVAAQATPYPLPRLAFDKVDFVGAMKRAQMNATWISEFTTYLQNPEEFWSKCVLSQSESAKHLGGMVPTDAQKWGEDACQNTTKTYHQCLDGAEIGNAIMCLQEHINNTEANGE